MNALPFPEHIFRLLCQMEDDALKLQCYEAICTYAFDEYEVPNTFPWEVKAIVEAYKPYHRKLYAGYMTTVSESNSDNEE